jgi:hypothetical protein
MREIKLTHGKIALVDNDDYERLAPFKWHAMKTKQIEDKWYAKQIIRVEGEPTQNIYMHRLIMGAGPGFEVDHRDRDGLNNIRRNLRVCSHIQNCANIATRASLSGYRGVYWCKVTRRWVAEAKVNYKTIRIGRYKDLIEAAVARDKYVSGLYGEFAVLNFPSASQ